MYPNLFNLIVFTYTMHYTIFLDIFQCNFLEEIFNKVKTKRLYGKIYHIVSYFLEVFTFRQGIHFRREA